MTMRHARLHSLEQNSRRYPLKEEGGRVVADPGGGSKGSKDPPPPPPLGPTSYE